MKIGVISDTHDNLEAIKKTFKIINERKIEFVFHLGDIIAPFTLKAIRELYKGKLVSIFGNNDGEKQGLYLTAKDLKFEIFEPPLVYELEGTKFMLYHNYPENYFAEIKGIDFLLFGHWHKVIHVRKENTIFLNPGEVCGYLSGEKTFAIIDLKSKEIEIVDIER
ncbi:MAG: metallophosphoesterase [Candidatus Hydrothermales bacterium]